MKGKFIFVAVGTLVIGGLAIWLGGKYADSNVILPPSSDAERAQLLKKIHGTNAAPPPAPVPVVALDMQRSVRLAIGGVGMADEEQNQRLGDLLTAQLTGAPGLELVERQELKKVLQELRLGLSGLVRANDAVRAGKLLRADWFLLGSPVTLEGKHHLVVRVVDARTGIMRDAGVFPSDQSVAELTTQLADFLRQCRQNAAAAKSRIYLSVGSFEDLSLNRRRAELPQELRAYLIAAYRKNPAITLLEREFADVLLKELQLDLAGLTEQSATNQPASMASGYWMVDGSYQSYETTEFEVELKLQVTRMLGRNEQVEMREKPGTPLFEKIKTSIDAVIRTNQAALTPTRRTEINTQLAKGEDLLALRSRIERGGDYAIIATWPGDRSELGRIRRNTEEAIKAFEVVLLLDPDNRLAKMYLAACFRRDYPGRYQKARELYRQVVDSPIKDKWTPLAQKGLDIIYWPNTAEKQRWFTEAAAGAANADAVAFYQGHADRAAKELAIRKGGKEAETLAEAKLFEGLEYFDKMIHGKGGNMVDDHGMYSYVRFFGEDPAVGAQRLADLYPKIRERFPDAAPYFLAAIVRHQVDTNAPIVAEFEQTLDFFIKHPEKVFSSDHNFWGYIQGRSHDWAVKQKVLPLAAKILEAAMRMSEVVPKIRGLSFSTEDRITLAYHYTALKRWQEALTIFESYGNVPLTVGGKGPWGEDDQTLLPNKLAKRCRRELGLPVAADPREFELGDTWYHLHSSEVPRKMREDRGLFHVEGEGVWLTLNHDLMHLDFDWRTNLLMRIPGVISALWVDATNVWVGTLDGGLFELEKSTRQLRQFKVNDGLLMNDIASLHRSGDTLWIGYGNPFNSKWEPGDGGLGHLNLVTRRFTSFTASVLGTALTAKPPRQPIHAIQRAASGDVWYLMGGTVARYRPAENVWETRPNAKGVSTRAVIGDGDRLIRLQELEMVNLAIGLPRVPGVTNHPPPNRMQAATVLDQPRIEATLKTNGSGLKVLWAHPHPYRISHGNVVIESLRDGGRRVLLEQERLPRAPTAMFVDGEKLWVGGVGYIAQVDLREDKIKKIAYVPARNVAKIQVVNGWLWVHYDNHIYRTRLGAL